MGIFDVFTLLLIFSAAFSYVNSRWVHLPPTIAFMLGSIVVAMGLLFLSYLDVPMASEVMLSLQSIDFSTTVLYGILSFLLFAGALQLDIREVAEQKWLILTLATLGVIISTFIVGTLMYWIFGAIGVPIPYLFALGFGALISPTDPVVVINMLKRTKTPKALKMQIMGEALFNDGIAIVLFTIIFELARLQTTFEWSGLGFLLFKQLIGSTALGLIFGWVTTRALSHVTVRSSQILITLGLVAGGYDLASVWGMSGPIAVVVMGLIVRNTRTDEPREELYSIWELLDEFLNAALFVLMGLQILSLTFMPKAALAGLGAIVVVLIGRFVSMWLPVRAFRFIYKFPRHAVTLLTWGGLRGGVSLALAMSLPTGLFTNAILIATYFVVIFSLLVQGLTFRNLVHSTSY